jgi:hypothetical protein
MCAHRRGDETPSSVWRHKSIKGSYKELDTIIHTKKIDRRIKPEFFCQNDLNGATTSFFGGVFFRCQNKRTRFFFSISNSRHIRGSEQISISHPTRWNFSYFSIRVCDSWLTILVRVFEHATNGGVHTRIIQGMLLSFIVYYTVIHFYLDNAHVYLYADYMGLKTFHPNSLPAGFITFSNV